MPGRFVPGPEAVAVTSLAGLARTIQRTANRRDLVRLQQDRDQILAALYAGTVRGDAAVERFAAAAAELQSLEDAMAAAVTELRNSLDNLTAGQGSRDDQTAPPKPKRKRKHEPDP